MGVFLPPNPIQPNACTRIAAIDIVPPSLGSEGPTSYRLHYDASQLNAEAVTIPNDAAPVERARRAVERTQRGPCAGRQTGCIDGR